MYTYVATGLIAASVAFTGACSALYRAERVKPAFCFDIGGTCKLYGWESPKSNYRSVSIDNCSPTRQSVLSYTYDTSRTVAPSSPTVLTVLAFGCDPKICNSVVRPIPVNMVNHSGRPLPKFIEPSESVSLIVDFSNHYDRVPVRVYVPNRGTDRPSANSFNAGKTTAFSVVEKSYSELVSRKGRIEIAHAVRPYNDGLGSDAYGLIHRGHCAF